MGGGSSGVCSWQRPKCRHLGQSEAAERPRGGTRERRKKGLFPPLDGGTEVDLTASDAPETRYASSAGAQEGHLKSAARVWVVESSNTTAAETSALRAVGASADDQRTGYVHEVVIVQTHQWGSHDVVT